MLTCDQCQATNARDSKFCQSCGASLASVAASEREADEAEAEVMLLEVKKAQGALLAVSILQLLGAGLMLALGAVDTTTGIVMFGIAGVFFGLWAWAKTSPLPAAIVGFGLFATLHGVEAIMDPATLTKGIVVKIIVIVILGRAIQAGIKHREFMRERGLG